MKNVNKFFGHVHTATVPLKDGKRDTIVQWICDIKIVEWYTTYLLKKPLTDDEVADKVQEIFLMVCEIPQKKWDELYQQGKYSVSAYVTGIIHQQIVSVNSKVWKYYGKHKERMKTMDELFWEKYYEEH